MEPKACSGDTDLTANLHRNNNNAQFRRERRGFGIFCQAPTRKTNISWRNILDTKAKLLVFQTKIYNLLGIQRAQEEVVDDFVLKYEFKKRKRTAVISLSDAMWLQYNRKAMIGRHDAKLETSL